MKTPLISLLNSIGFQNPAQKALYAAKMLSVATVSSPAVTITPAVKSVAAKPAVLAQTAKPARAASAAVLATDNTVGYAFGELYLNSPAYPVGTAIPAIPAKPASAEVIGVPAVAAVVGSPAVVAPAIKALPGWHDKITITYGTSGVSILAYLPCASSPGLIGANDDGVDVIQEITPAALNPSAWLDTKASNTPETLLAEVSTIERYLYKYALELVALPTSTPATASVMDEVLVVNGIAVKCKKITLALSADNYDSNSESLQLNKVHPPLITHASDTAYLAYLPTAPDEFEIGIIEHVEQRRSAIVAPTIAYYYTLATTLLNLSIGQTYSTEYFTTPAASYPYYKVSAQ